MSNFQYNTDYTALLREISLQPVQYNARTGQKLRALHGGAMIKVDLQNNNVPIPLNRKYRPYVAAAEAVWILSQTDSIEWITKHCSIWNKFATNGIIENSYGTRMGHQLEKAILQLLEDPSSRRVVIDLWDSQNDNNTSRNTPCPTQIAISCNGEEVNMCVFMRSSDVFVGLPYDIMTWSIILDCIATALDKNPRFLTFFLAHPHIYENHRDYLTPRGTHYYSIQLLNLGPSEILEQMDSYVTYFKQNIHAVEPPVIFDPKPEVFE